MNTLVRSLAAMAVGLLMTVGATAQQNRQFTAQYSFGDSLSDNGNLRALTNGAQPPAPYFNGRFSNGPTFVEQLGNTLAPGFVPSPVSALRANLNFAVGGATAGTGSPVPNLAQQLAAYRTFGQPARATDLFTLTGGANDLIPVLSAPTTPANPASLDAAGAAAAQALAANVQALVGLGAKNIVVAGMPNLGATPRSLAAGGPGGAGATLGLRASSAFNNELRARLQALAGSPAAADVNLVYLDFQGIIDRLAVDYRLLGFNNVTSYYLAPAAQGGGVGDPNSYVFWDDIHPTARTHALVAAIVTEQLNPAGPLGAAAMQGTAALALQSLSANTLDARLSQLAVSRRARGRVDAYAAFTYGDGSRGRDGWRPKFDYDAQVFTAGADLSPSDGFFAGGALNVGRLEAEANRNAGEFTMEDATARIYAVWQGGPVSLLLDAGYGVLEVKDIRRTTAFGGLAARGKTSGDHWGAGIKAAWAVEFGTASVRPWAGLRTERVTLEGYTESDVPALTMSFGEQEATSTQGAAGVDFVTSWKLGGRELRLDLRGVLHGEIGSRTREVTGRLADNFTRATTLSLEDGDGEGVELGGALTWFFAKSWSASVGYAADVRSGERVANRGTFSLQTGF